MTCYDSGETTMRTALVQIGEDLSRAIRQDHQKAQRRTRRARTLALATASCIGLSGTALAAGQITGAIDLSPQPQPLAHCLANAIARHQAVHSIRDVERLCGVVSGAPNGGQTSTYRTTAPPYP